MVATPRPASTSGNRAVLTEDWNSAIEVAPDGA
jgi:hypothetical protein